jgi:hypothetical protein
MRYILLCLSIFLISFTSYSQITLPYEEDFSNMYDSVYTEASSNIQGVEGLSFGGNWTLEYVDSIDIDNRFHLLGIEAGGNLKDSLVFRLDLSSYDVNDDDIVIGFDVQTYLDQDWSVLIRENATSSAIRVGAIDLSQGNNDIKTIIGRNVSKSLADSSQNYSDQFEIIFTRTRFSGNASEFEIHIDRFFVKQAPAVDLDLLQVSAPKPRIDLDGTEKVTLKVKNYGNTPVSNIPVQYELRSSNDTIFYEEDFAVSLAPNDTLDLISAVDFDYSMDSVFTIFAQIELPDDEYRFNNDNVDKTFKPDVYRGELPFVETFESTTNYQYRGFAPAFPITTGFSYNSENKSESYCTVNSSGIYLGRIDENPQDYILLSMDLSDNEGKDLVLDFDYSYYNTRVDSGKVLIRGNEDQEWIDLYTWQKEAWTINTKKIEYLSLTEALNAAGQSFGETFQIMFYREGGISSNFNLSYIQVRERPEFDLEAVNLSPDIEGGSALALPDTFHVSVVNHGKIDLEDFMVNLDLKNEFGMQRLTQTTSLDVEDSIILKFPNTLDFSEAGNYKITAYSDIENDGFKSNDSSFVTTFRSIPASGVLPYFNDFSTLESKRYELQQGVFDSNPEFIYERQNLVEIIDNYGFRTDKKSLKVDAGDAVILAIDLSTVDTTQSILLDFAYSPRLAYGEYLRPIQLRGNQSENWVTIVTPKSPFPSNSDSLSAIQSGWYRYTAVDLSEALRLADQNFSSDTQIKTAGSTNYISVVYDDIIIYEKPSTNLDLWEMKSPSSFIDQPSDSIFVFRVINRGATEINSFDILIDMVGPVGDTLTHEVQLNDLSLSPSDTLRHEIANPFDMGSDGEYIFIGRINTNDDNFIFDNELLAKTTNRTVVNEFPYQIDVNALSEDTVWGSGEFDSIPGWYIESYADFVYTEVRNIYSFPVDSTVRAVGTSSPIQRSELQQYIWTFNMEEFTVEDSVTLSLFYDLSYFPTSYDENDGLYIRGNESEDWKVILKHRNGNARYRYVDNSFQLQQQLKENGQEFSSTTQIKVRVDGGSSGARFQLRAFELNAVKVEEEEEVLSIQAKFEGLPYPNPASGYLFVPSEKSTEVIIFDMKGREVSKGRTNSKIDVSKLKSGLYVAMIKKANGTYRNFRWMKE